MTDRRTRLYAIAAAAVAAGGIGGTLFLALPDGSDPFAECRTARVAGAAEIGGPFTLISENGETVTDAEVLTRPSLVYFGYTFCPDVCPFDTVRNAEAVDLLTEKGHDVQPVFVSVDPGRDTPEALTEFTDYIHDDMLGLTGTEAQVQAAADAYKAYFRVHDTAAEDEFYLVDHSTFTYLMLPGTGFAEFFRREATPAEMADTVACFLDAAA